MDWNGYTVFSVLSGAALVVVALIVRGMTAKDRLCGLIAGAIFVSYGIFAASQTSGTFVFPIWIFIVPPAAIVYLVAAAVGKSRRSAPEPASRSLGAAPPLGEATVTTPHAQPTGVPGSCSPTVPPAPPGRPAAWAPPPPPPGSSATGV